MMVVYPSITCLLYTSTPNYKGDKALLRAIQVLESVREEGQDKAEWNMRMAYAYQYLHGQEEKAIPYACLLYTSRCV